MTAQLAAFVCLGILAVAITIATITVPGRRFSR